MKAILCWPFHNNNSGRYHDAGTMHASIHSDMVNDYTRSDGVQTVCPSVCPYVYAVIKQHSRDTVQGIYIEILWLEDTL